LVLSEELLLTQKREEKTSVFALRATPRQVRRPSPFFLQKKWRLEIFIVTHHSEPLFEAKNSEFRCEIKF